MLELMNSISADARERLAEWMADTSMKNMLRLDADAALPYGGEENLRAKLKIAHQQTLGDDL